MRLTQLARRAYRLGQQDARQGRVFRHSADPGTWIRALGLLPNYDAGWQTEKNS